MSDDQFESIVDRLERRAGSTPTKLAYRDKTSGQWRSTSWSEYNDETRQFAKSLLAAGFEKRDAVAILGSNRPEWTVAFVGAMRISAVGVGIYSTNSPEEVAYIVQHSGAKIVVVEDNDQLAKVTQVWGECPTLNQVVLMRHSDVGDDARVVGWDDFLSSGSEIGDEALQSAMDAVQADDVTDYIYTSGTTGPPKAVMLTQDNLSWTADKLGAAAEFTDEDSMVSYLPLSHIAEQMATIHIAVSTGCIIHYCHEPLSLADYIKECEPTVFFGVPRVWERFYAAVSARLGEATGARAKLLAWARSVGTEVTDLQTSGREPAGALAVKYRLADKLIFSKLRANLGMSNTRAFFSGAAAVPVDILKFFASLGLIVHEIYGQSEDSAPTTANLPGAARFGTVGKPLDGVEVKIGDDGEILVRGRNVFAGYYNDPGATAETLINGWLHSGDLGQFDDDGFLHITGRKKDIIVTSGGKNIAPKNLEGALVSLELVEHAVCIGEQRRHLVALLTLEPEAKKRFTAEIGTDDEAVVMEKVRERLNVEIMAINGRFARVEHIRNIAILPEQFSVDSGELTATFKIKRAVVNQKFADVIDSAYAEGETIGG